MLVFLKVLYGDLPDDIIFNIAIYAGDTTLYSKRGEAFICGYKQTQVLGLNLTQETPWNGAGIDLSTSMLEKLKISHFTVPITMPPKILMMLQWKDVKLTTNLIVVQTYQDENEFDV